MRVKSYGKTVPIEMKPEWELCLIAKYSVLARRKVAVAVGSVRGFPIAIPSRTLPLLISDVDALDDDNNLQ